MSSTSLPIVSVSPYFTGHRHTLEQLFKVLGETYLHDPEALVAWMERRWLGAEHGPGEGKPQYPEAALEQAWPLLEKLDLVDRKQPTSAEYDEVVVLGAAGIGLYRRLGLVRESGVRAKVLTVLAGQRPHSGNARDGSLDEYVDPAGRFAAQPGWTAPPALLAELQRLTAAGVAPLVAAKQAIPSETDMARILMSKHWPDMCLVATTAPTAEQKVVNELGLRHFAWEEYESGSQFPRLRLFDSAPVERRGRDGTPLPARPTSRSSIREWVESWGDIPPRTVLAVVNQPHLVRVEGDIASEIEALGVAFPEIEVAGCEVLRASVDVNLVLGEIPARINSERRRALRHDSEPG
jgi:hypothetical protein